MDLGSGDPQDPKDSGRSEYLKGLALLAWISTELIALSGAGIMLGWALHRWFNWPLVLAGLFGLLGLCLAFVRVYRASKNMESRHK